LDIDRCDYLKRDSFYTGVSEGNINSQRLISMMNVANNKLVVEEKGIYSIEKFLTARRLMYWQVYLHKTGLVSEQIIIKILKRAKILSIENDNFTSGSIALDFFLKQRIDITNFTNDVLENFSLLDDIDLLLALKTWSYHSDFVLKNLSERILNRNLLKIKFVNKLEIESQLKCIKKDWNKFLRVDIDLMEYFVFYGKISNTGYEKLNNPIEILNKNGSISTINQSLDNININALSKKITRYYICFPKEFL
jgi:HD superfamily phosphohydrolase